MRNRLSPAGRVSAACAYALIACLFLLLLFSFLGKSVGEENMSLAYAYRILSGAVTYILPALILKTLSGRTGIPYTGTVPGVMPFSKALTLCSSSALAIFLFGIVYAGVFPSAGISPALPESYREFMLGFAAFAVVPSICEELFFRGCVAQALTVFGRVTSVLVSSIIFGLMHLSFSAFPFAFVSGILICSVYSETGNLWCAVSVHFTNNFLSYLMAYLKKICDEKTYLYIFCAVLIVFIAVIVVSAVLSRGSRLGRVRSERDTVSYPMTDFFSAPMVLFVCCIAVVFAILL